MATFHEIDRSFPIFIQKSKHCTYRLWNPWEELSIDPCSMELHSFRSNASCLRSWRLDVLQQSNVGHLEQNCKLLDQELLQMLISVLLPSPNFAISVFNCKRLKCKIKLAVFINAKSKKLKINSCEFYNCQMSEHSRWWHEWS